MRSNPVLSYYKIKIQTPADEWSAGVFCIIGVRMRQRKKGIVSSLTVSCGFVTLNIHIWDYLNNSVT